MSLVFRREIHAENIHLQVVSLEKIFQAMNLHVITQGVGIDEEQRSKD